MWGDLWTLLTEAVSVNSCAAGGESQSQRQCHAVTVSSRFSRFYWAFGPWGLESQVTFAHDIPYEQVTASGGEKQLVLKMTPKQTESNSLCDSPAAPARSVLFLLSPVMLIPPGLCRFKPAQGNQWLIERRQRFRAARPCRVISLSFYWGSPRCRSHPFSGAKLSVPWLNFCHWRSFNF